MLILDLIEKLDNLRRQELWTYPMMEEPEIHIDLYSPEGEYRGITPHIAIDRSADYVNKILVGV